MSIKIKNEPNISGISINDKEIINIQHADDLTLALKDKNSLDLSLKIINEFCNHAGSKININMTECILLGGLKDMFDKINGIKATNKAVMCLGIYIGHDKEECYNI